MRPGPSYQGAATEPHQRMLEWGLTNLLTVNIRKTTPKLENGIIVIYVLFANQAMVS